MDMAFSIGGVGNGVQKGLQYDLDFMRAFVWAVKEKNSQAVSDLEAIAQAHVTEIAGTSQLVAETHAIGLLLSPDPFSGSRKLMQDFTAKYGRH